MRRYTCPIRAETAFYNVTLSDLWCHFYRLKRTRTLFDLSINSTTQRVVYKQTVMHYFFVFGRKKGPVAFLLYANCVCSNNRIKYRKILFRANYNIAQTILSRRSWNCLIFITCAFDFGFSRKILPNRFTLILRKPYLDVTRLNLKI